MNCLKCGQAIEHPDTPHYGLHSNCFAQYFNIAAPAEFTALQRRSSSSTSSDEANLAPQNTSFFHGKFKKYSAELGGNAYILKMRQNDAPELPEVEYLCNKIGLVLGIPVAEFYYINFNGDNTFVTKNFTRNEKMPADLQHIYHFRPNNEHHCEGIIKAITDVTKRPHDVKIFLKTILFDALIGNNDRHGRNLALVTISSGISLSPIYDNVSYLSLESGNMLKADFNPTGKIGTKETDEPSMRDYVKELKRLGYADTTNEFHQLIKTVKLEELINDSFCSSLMKDALKKLIWKRIQELANETAN